MHLASQRWSRTHAAAGKRSRLLGCGVMPHLPLEVSGGSWPTNCEIVYLNISMSVNVAMRTR